MDWTETGASPPLLTKPWAASPRVTLRVGLRWIMLESPLAAGDRRRGDRRDPTCRGGLNQFAPGTSKAKPCRHDRWYRCGVGRVRRRGGLLAGVLAQLVEGDVF